MIIVTGTKRSGTSMWMQILAGAGFPMIGTAFPADWKKTIGPANPDGFFESLLRGGIYFATNPHPSTGKYLSAEKVTKHAVKVFIPGLIRTERGFIGRVLASMRDWREYEASVERLYALEREAFEKAGREHDPKEIMTPALEWWWENYTLITDVARRRYAIHLQSYDGLLADPEKVVSDALRWIGWGDPIAAARRVKPSNRNFVRPNTSSLEPEFAEVFDELYDVVHRRRNLAATLIAKMDEVHEKLWPRIAEELRTVHHARRAKQKRLRARKSPGSNGAGDFVLESALADLDATLEAEE